MKSLLNVSAQLRVGLLINPYAGLGGPLALKGSDHVSDELRQAALLPVQQGQSRAQQRCATFLAATHDLPLHWVTVSGAMGQSCLTGSNVDILDFQASTPSTAEDTQRAAAFLLQAGLDLLIFVGGDGTARDICSAVREGQPVLGIPAGVKIHSGVYAISPRAAGALARQLIEGGLVRLTAGEVRDLDENALREGRVAARWYGELTVPEPGHFMQHVKQAGVESEELVLGDLADWLRDSWEDNVRYVFGPGSTLHGLAQNLDLETTLLGVDVIENGQVIGCDVSEAELFELVNGHPAFLLVTAIGGQGHILGRGNQQISPRVLRCIGLDRLRVVATKRKLGTLNGRPLLVDSGDPQLDDNFPNAVRVWAGYKEELLYPLGHHTGD